MHPYSKLVLYGNEKIKGDSRIISLSSSLAQERISTFSHMCVLFKPTNLFYGKIHARLTWNPYFKDLEKTIKTVTQ